MNQTKTNKDNKDNKVSKINQAKEYILYDPYDGIFYVKRHKLKQLLPTEDGYLVFLKEYKRYKVKANKIAYELGNNSVVPNDKRILHKNLDRDDYKLSNLSLVSSSTMLLISEAQRNLSGGLKLHPHKTDMFSYVVQWIDKRQVHYKVIPDLGLARKFYTSLQLKYAKVLGKYTVSN